MRILLSLSAALLIGACAQNADTAKSQVTMGGAKSSAELVQPLSAAATPIEANYARFKRWFGGEFDNNKQVWQQKEDAQKTATGKVENPFEHVHHIFAPINSPAVGKDVYFIKQYLDGDPSKIYRQRAYRFNEMQDGAIKLEIFSFVDEAAQRDLHLKPALANALTPAMLKATPGCDVIWRFDEKTSAYAGSMVKDACKITSRSTGKPIFINDTLKLTDAELWISDVATDEAGKVVWGRTDGQPHRNRKVRYFKGWFYINRAGVDAKKTDTKFSGSTEVLIHSEGGRWPIKFDDGKATGYTLELAQLTYANTKTPILKFTLLDDATGKSATYIWSDTSANRIGMNLQWFQTGLTLKESGSEFGF